MAVSVRDLLAQPGLGLTVITGEHRLDHELRWVATSEHLDPTPFLEGGELLLTTGMLLPRTTSAVRAYVDRLADVGVVGIGLGVELVHDKVPRRLVEAAGRAGLLLLEIDRPTPFVAISKAVSDLIAREQYAKMIRISQAQQDLTSAAVREGAPGVVRTAARLVDGWSIMLDSDRTVQYSYPPTARKRVAALAEELDRLGAGGPAAASLVERGEHISLHTLTSTRRVRGFLVCGMGRQPGAADRIVLSVATALLSFSQQRPGRGERERQAALLRLARSGTITDPTLLADLGGGLFRRAGVQVLAVTGAAHEVDGLTLHLEDEPAEHCLVAREGRLLVAVLSESRVAPTLDHVRRSHLLRAGLSDTVRPTELADGTEQARRVLSLAVARDAQVLTYADAMSGVVGIADPADAAAYAERLLRPLLDYGSRSGIDMLETLRVWLRHHGLFDPAAGELGLHRHTLRHRVRRAEQLLDRSLSDPDTRMDLWFALKVVHSGQH